MELGKKIAYYRKNLNITQDALAKQLGISNQAVSKWETDQSCPDVELLPKLADIFGISLDELFEREIAVKITEENEEATADDASEKAEIVVLETSAEKATDLLPWEDDGKLRAVLYVGRHLVQKSDIEDKYGKVCREVTIEYSGSIGSVDSCFNVCCEEVGGNVRAGNYVQCGDVGGNVSAGSHVECGDVGGSASGGYRVECGDVSGDAKAGNHVECGDVEGNVTAGSYVECGDIEGNLKAGGNVNCGDVSGNVAAEKNVYCGDVEGDIQVGEEVHNNMD